LAERCYVNMPRKTYNTKADFDADYDIGAEPDGRPGTRGEVRLNYHRAAMLPYCEKRAAKLVEIFAWPTSTKILMVGVGYAWTAEILETVYGYTNIVTTDTSPYIQSTQDADEAADYDAAITAVGLNPAADEGAAVKSKLVTRQGGVGNRRRHSREVKNESLSNNGSRNRIRQVLGDIEVGITEEVIAVLDDSEFLTVIDWVDKINAGIARIHLTTELQPGTPQNPIFNWKTLADWKALAPSDTFVSLNSWEVL